MNTTLDRGILDTTVARRLTGTERAELRLNVTHLGNGAQSVGDRMEGERDASL